MLNSFGRNLSAIREKSGSTNPANCHPEDLIAMGVEDDDEVTITSAFGSIPAIVKANDRIKRGVVAMHHCWGLSPDKQGAVRENGSNTNLLVDSEAEIQRYTGMVRSSSIPIKITKPITSA